MRKVFDKIKFFNKRRFYLGGDYAAFANLLKRGEKFGNME